MADKEDIFAVVRSMDGTENANVRGATAFFSVFTKYNKANDKSNNKAMRQAEREQEKQRKINMTSRWAEVSEGVWPATSREMTCSWNGGTCTHGANKGPTWTFSAEDQNGYYVKEFTDPTKCPSLRKEMRDLNKVNNSHCPPTLVFRTLRYARQPIASRITTDTTPGAFSIICPTCPQTHKARLAASCLTSASRRHADRRRITRTTGSSRRNGEKHEETKTAECRWRTT